MDRLSVGMDVHKEKVVMVGLPERGDTPVMRETFRGDNISGEGVEGSQSGKIRKVFPWR